MYKFTPGKEMEELKELWRKNKIKKVLSKGGILVQNIIEFDDQLKYIKYIIDNHFHYVGDFEIDWEETAKLVKSDVDVIGEQFKGFHEAAMKCSMKVSDFNKGEKMEKVVINNYEEFKENVRNKYGKANKVGDMIYFENDKTFELFLDDFTKFEFGCCCNLKEGIKVFNKNFNENFEYQEVEVIDSSEKWEKFQEKLSSLDWYFNRIKRNFFTVYKDKVNKSCDIEEIEKEFNVDLQIING